VDEEGARAAVKRLLQAFEMADSGIAMMGETLRRLLFASLGIESEIVAAADILAVVPGLTLPVATTGHLLALKVLSRDDRTRPQDVADLRALLRVATPQDLSTARSALALIQQRGFHRNRSLGPELDRAIADAR
jgi:hypothetical protein